MFKNSYYTEIFDILFTGRSACYRNESFPPTSNSIKTIQCHFGGKLPTSFIEFCSHSKSYCEWFCSIGENYQDWNHIIRVNSYFKGIRRRYSPSSIYKNVRDSARGKKWVNIKPKSHLVLRHGHDDHCLVLNTSKLTNDNDYELLYWNPGYYEEFGDSYENFSFYIKSLLEFSYEHTTQDRRNICKPYLV